MLTCESAALKDSIVLPGVGKAAAAPGAPDSTARLPST
jgi:hypothetical protein